MSAPERMWALTKITAGDYFLPTNDAAAIFRLTWHRDTRTWMLHRASAAGGVFDPDWGEHWKYMGCEATRREAIDEAMRLGSRAQS